MRLAMLAPIAWRVPPRHYGPWEQFVSLLTEGLVSRGVDVTLFATGDSKSGAKLVSVQPTGYSESTGVDVKVWEGLHISEVFERAGQFDLIHNSFDFLPLTYSALVATPMVTTIHGFSSERILPVYQKYNGRTHYIAISETDRHPTLDYLATIHHGIDITAFGISDNPDDYLLFLGRIHPEKGVEEAITVARRAGRALIIAGIVQDRAYFERCVAPYLGRHDGPLSRPDRPATSPSPPQRGRSPTSPDQLRGALWLQRSRGHGQRHPRDRICAGLNARAHQPWPERISHPQRRRCARCRQPPRGPRPVRHPPGSG